MDRQYNCSSSFRSQFRQVPRARLSNGFLPSRLIIRGRSLSVRRLFRPITCLYRQHLIRRPSIIFPTCKLFQIKSHTRFRFTTLGVVQRLLTKGRTSALSTRPTLRFSKALRRHNNSNLQVKMNLSVRFHARRLSLRVPNPGSGEVFFIIYRIRVNFSQRRCLTNPTNRFFKVSRLYTTIRHGLHTINGHRILRLFPYIITSRRFKYKARNNHRPTKDRRGSRRQYHNRPSTMNFNMITLQPDLVSYINISTHRRTHRKVPYTMALIYAEAFCLGANRW